MKLADEHDARVFRGRHEAERFRGTKISLYRAQRCASFKAFWSIYSVQNSEA